VRVVPVGGDKGFLQQSAELVICLILSKFSFN
jgi:hypothetical protein